MNDTDTGEAAERQIERFFWQRWIWLTGYVKRKARERRARKQNEAPADRAARVTANATFWIAVFTFVSLAVSGGTSLILRSQLKEMHDAGVDTHTLAQQTVNQATLLRQQMVGTYAAAIPKTTPWPAQLTNDLEYLNYVGIGMSFVNVGKVKATNFTADATMTRRALPNYGTIGTPEHKEISQAQIRPNDQNGPNSIGDAPSIRFQTKVLTQHDVALLQDLGETIEFSGSFQYGDGFGDTVHETFCFLYAILPGHVFAVTGAATGPGGGWFACDDGKRAVEQGLEWKQAH